MGWGEVPVDVSDLLNFMGTGVVLSVGGRSNENQVPQLWVGDASCE